MRLEQWFFQLTQRADSEALVNQHISVAGAWDLGALLPAAGLFALLLACCCLLPGLRRRRLHSTIAVSTRGMVGWWVRMFVKLTTRHQFGVSPFLKENFMFTYTVLGSAKSRVILKQLLMLMFKGEFEAKDRERHKAMKTARFW